MLASLINTSPPYYTNGTKVYLQFFFEIKIEVTDIIETKKERQESTYLGKETEKPLSRLLTEIAYLFTLIRTSLFYF
jgi:hypothetical protein